MVCLEGPNLFRLLQLAERKGMITSEYVFISMSVDVDSYVTRPWEIHVPGVDVSASTLQRHRRLFRFTKFVRTRMLQRVRDASIARISWYIKCALLPTLLETNAPAFASYDVSVVDDEKFRLLR